MEKIKINKTQEGYHIDFDKKEKYEECGNAINFTILNVIDKLNEAIDKINELEHQVKKHEYFY